MKADVSSNDGAAARRGSQSRLSRAPAIVLALTVSACAIYAAVNGPVLWSNAQRLKAEQIQQEDRMFCEKLHMPPGGESFPTCVGYLADVRRLHGDRVAAEAAGVF